MVTLELHDLNLFIDSRGRIAGSENTCPAAGLWPEVSVRLSYSIFLGGVEPLCHVPWHMILKLTG